MTTLHRNVVILTVEDPKVLEEIRLVAPLEEALVGWLSPTEAVLDPARLKGVLDALEARGVPALVRRATVGGEGR